LHLITTVVVSAIVAVPVVVAVALVSPVVA